MGCCRAAWLEVLVTSAATTTQQFSVPAWATPHTSTNPTPFNHGCDAHRLSQKIKLPVRGRAMAGGLRLAPKALEFGDVVSNSYSDLLVMATNTNSVLPLRFKVGRTLPGVVAGSVQAEGGGQEQGEDGQGSVPSCGGLQEKGLWSGGSPVRLHSSAQQGHFADERRHECLCLR